VIARRERVPLDFERCAAELLTAMASAPLTLQSEAFLVIERETAGGEYEPPLWADLSGYIHWLGENRPTEEQIRAGAHASLRAWLAHCRRDLVAFVDLPHTLCRVTGLSLEIHHFDS
jgi:hypothetical protein